MPRDVPEWHGKTDDSPVPDRVKLRVFEKWKGRCHRTGRLIRPGDKWQIDHIKALINGGENRETNLAPILTDKHREKTAEDVAERAKVRTKAKKHIGIRAPSSFQNARGGKFKTRLTSRGPRTELR